MRRLLRYLWASPTTLIGLLFLPLALIGRGGGVRLVEGAIELHGGRVRWFLRRCTFLKGGAAAMTLGHVVLGQNRRCLVRTRAHERVHVRQAERWGPLFLPAYAIASVIAWWRGGSAYRDNFFEREAYDVTAPPPAPAPAPTPTPTPAPARITPGVDGGLKRIRKDPPAPR